MSKKRNKIYYPQGCSYALVFYNNYDGFFIVDVNDVPLIEQHTWSCDKTRYEPITMIDGKKVRLSRILAKTPDDLVCDHINCNVADNRRCNLRNCTTAQNNFNRERYAPYVECLGNKFIIKNMSSHISTKVLFDTEEEVNQVMNALVGNIQGEFSYFNSQEIAKENETFEFRDYIICDSIYEEIYSLSEINIYRRILKNILRDRSNGRITDEQFLMGLDRLKSIYSDYKKESA